MSSRFTETEKWKNRDFRKLSPQAKLLLIYMFDHCDIAGFWEVDLEHAQFCTGINDLEGPFKALASSYKLVKKDDLSVIWIKNFLLYQKNWPLNENNTAHRGIIKILQSHNSFMDVAVKHLEKKTSKPLASTLRAPLKPLSRGTGKGKGIGNRKEKREEIERECEREKEKREEKTKTRVFKAPTIDDVKAYAEQLGYVRFDSERFWYHYESNGWKVGRNSMKSWKAAVVNWQSNDGQYGRKNTDVVTVDELRKGENNESDPVQ